MIISIMIITKIIILIIIIHLQPAKDARGRGVRRRNFQGKIIRIQHLEN